MVMLWRILWNSRSSGSEVESVMWAIRNLMGRFECLLFVHPYFGMTFPDSQFCLWDGWTISNVPLLLETYGKWMGSDLRRFHSGAPSAPWAGISGAFLVREQLLFQECGCLVGNPGSFTPWFLLCLALWAGLRTWTKSYPYVSMVCKFAKWMVLLEVYLGPTPQT